MERWRDIPSLPGYAVSDCGRVRSNLRRCLQSRWSPTTRLVPGKILSQHFNRKGYLIAKVALIGRSVHRLVLEAFVGSCPPGMEARHLDGDKQNNRLSNLAWGTPKENAADVARHGRVVRGEQKSSAKLTENDVLEIRGMLADGYSLKSIGRSYGVCGMTIFAIKHGRTWRHVK